MCNFVRMYYVEQFCEIILDLGELIRRRYRFNRCLIWRPSCSVKRNDLYKFERGHHGDIYVKL